ncbi:MAG TPA: helix-turn-helix domain-containing protein, partial [Candidatus Krumholzibacterium sp.]|nr:helix-turn-helix domain-containing protein [Candidatus Krumholzibacterium sp.]
ELEGSLIKILACASLTNQDINVDMAREVLKDIIKTPSLHISAGNIQKAVSQRFDIPVDSLRAKTRINKVVKARHVAIFLTRELTSLSLVEIGKRFGGRDHSTVLHSCRKVEKEIATDAVLENTVSILREELRG